MLAGLRARASEEEEEGAPWGCAGSKVATACPVLPRSILPEPQHGSQHADGQTDPADGSPGRAWAGNGKTQPSTRWKGPSGGRERRGRGEGAEPSPTLPARARAQPFLARCSRATTSPPGGYSSSCALLPCARFSALCAGEWATNHRALRQPNRCDEPKK